MQDVLSRPDQSLPIEELDIYELSLEDSSDFLHPFIVRRTHYEWDDRQQQTVPADHIIDLLRTLEQAETRYAVHLQVLADLGYTCSDMDPKV